MAENDEQVVEVTVTVSDDSLFGGFNDPGYDWAGSSWRYRELLRERLSAEFPDAEITVERGEDDRYSVLRTDEEFESPVNDEQEEAYVKRIADELHATGEWWVRTGAE